MWWVKYHSYSGEKFFQSNLNILPLVDKENEVDNRFTPIETKTIDPYYFILLDQLDGRMWHVEWSVS